MKNDTIQSLSIKFQWQHAGQDKGINNKGSPMRKTSHANLNKKTGVLLSL